jgi:hypothetical protein
VHHAGQFNLTVSEQMKLFNSICKNPDVYCTRTFAVVYRRAVNKLDYDGKAGVVTNAPEANAFLKRPYRDGWPING